MRLIRFGFSIRRLMILVATVAILLWVGQMAFRSHRALKLARQYQADAALFRQAEQHWLKKVRDSEQDVAKTEPSIALAEQGVERSKGEVRKNYELLLSQYHAVMEAYLLHAQLPS